MPRESYEIGKRGETQTWDLLKKQGYIRPTKDQRTEIYEYYKKKFIEIDKRGFDVILEQEIDYIGKKDISLFEVKTTGKKRGEKIESDFIGLGFTLTEKEYSNAISLKKRFKFIFVNLALNSYKIFDLDDFFNDKKARIYKTWSVFIKNSI